MKASLDVYKSSYDPATALTRPVPDIDPLLTTILAADQDACLGFRITRSVGSGIDLQVSRFMRAEEI
jgi:hypothetical protein